ncbi:MAG: SRPBCC family protein, partial [Candidatus Dormibacteraceae bacterium]
MAWNEFSAAVTVKCSPKRAFDYFADYRHVAGVLDGVSKWEPIGNKAKGVGARYDVEMAAFGFPLKNVLRLNRWSSPHEIAWASESGLIKQKGGFTFTEVGNGVRIELRIAYEPPAAFIGRAIARRLDWMVRGRLERAREGVDEIAVTVEAKVNRIRIPRPAD